MESVKVSPKYQLVIPRSVREALKIRPGQRLHILPYENRVEVIPEKNMASMRGFLAGIDTTFPRDEQRA